ncbi:MAG: hypothetical protein A3J06_00345 [Candidatus Moranbacteria bacterium RIFCSPLOWO2_02_FULL_48_19]|nr:MAG: hypothetical protein A3J06_00345 [Candidatus Moranbacteria bacterium RIFCSPLOWO2_02_FULL_48_19]
MALPRLIKQFLIALIYLIIAVLLGVLIYYAFIKAPETCSDSKQNQNETGIDCGGVCAACKENITGEALQFMEQAFVPAGNGKYDVLARVYNPNDVEGASSFTYTAVLKDSGGNVLATRSGKSYILPQENKYILELNLATTATPAMAAFTVDSVEWARLSGYQEKPTVNIYQKSYSEISSGAGFGEVKGLLMNESSYDFRSIIVKVILRDSVGSPLAFNSTEIRTVLSSEERDFRLVWPSAFPGVVEKVEMEVDADVYHSDNFIRQYLPGGKFQEFAPPSAF